MDRGTRRKTDWKHAIKKRKLALNLKFHKPAGSECGFEEFDNLHQYSKGKITPDDKKNKTRNKGYARRHRYGNYNPSINYKHSEKIKIDSLENQEEEFLKDNE